MLKVNLMSAVAAPMAEPELVPEIKEMVSAVVTLKKIITNEQAVKKIAPTKPKINKPRPIKKTVKKIVKPKKRVKVKKKITKNKKRQTKVTTRNNKPKLSSLVTYKTKYRKQVPPVYPSRALKRGQEGMVVLRVQVTLNGLPSVLKIAKSSGYHALDASAMAAVRKWKFEPIHNGKRAVTGWVQVPVRFVISD